MLRADRARELRSTAIGYHFAPLFTLNCLATDNFEDQRVAATMGKRKGRPKFVVENREDSRRSLKREAASRIRALFTRFDLSSLSRERKARGIEFVDCR